MTASILYLIGTIATWVAWCSFGVAVFRGVEALLKPKGIARSRSTAAFVKAAATAAIGFLVVLVFPMKSGLEMTGFRLPIVWPVLPFSGWGIFISVCFALYRGYQLLIDRPVSSDDQTQSQQSQIRAWMRQAIAALICAFIFFLFYRSNKETIEIVKGSIPFSLTSALAIVLFAVVALILMAIAATSVTSRGVAKKVVLHVMLLVGSFVFGLPFFWLVITSFKEDIDMSSANGLVWIPKVSEEVPYRDPTNPYYQTTMRLALQGNNYRDQSVQADLIQKESNGKYLLNVARPMTLEGTTFEAEPSTLTEIDRMIPVVSGTYKDTAYVGKVIKEMNDGHKEIYITSPASLAGQTYMANPSDVTPVRHVGLKLSNYPDALEYLPKEANMGLTYLKNTLILVFFSVVGTILSSSLVAYAFSRLKFPGKGALFTVLLSTMMLPAAVTLLPTFLIFKNLGWIDTLYPLWVPAFFASAFNVFLLRQFFMTIPNELEDASKIDGCSYIKTFWTIMLPQVKPALAVIAIWTFMAVWNNFMGPLVYINSPENMPIAYAVQLFKTDRGGEPGLMMAFATMSMIPVLVLFFAAQKYFIEGVTLSGLGGR
ncbi:MAG TPA: carbohydrate ABC transporter permease [Fimbriimonadaceae bacterium]